MATTLVPKEDLPETTKVPSSDLPETAGGAALVPPKGKITPSSLETQARVGSLAEQAGEYFFEPPTREDFDLGGIGQGAITGAGLMAAAPKALQAGGKVVGAIPLPATRAVGKGMQALGVGMGKVPMWQRLLKGGVGGGVAETTEQAGEYMGVPRAITIPSSLAVGGLAQSFLGGEGAKARAAQKELGQALKARGKEAEQAITKREAGETQAEYEKRARQQTNLKQAQEKFSGAAQQERETSARKFADLGTPKGESEFGQEIQRRVTGTEFTREARRSQRATEDFKAYFQQAKDWSKSPEREEMLAKLKAMSESPSVGADGRKYAEQAYKDLVQSSDALGTEKEFRKFFEAASGPPQLGYSKVQQDANKTVSDIISNALDKHAPKRIEARSTYAEYSTPLDAYETLFGKKGVATERAVPGQTKMMPADYPKTYFKNADTVRELRKQLAGDEAAVRKFANQFVVNELEGKNATQAAQWLKNNREMVNEIQGLNTRVERYVQDLQRSESAAATKEAQAEKLGKKAKEVGAERETAETKIAKTAQEQRKQIDEFKRQLNLNPKNVKGIADNMIDYLDKNKMLPDEKIRALQAGVENVEKTTSQLDKAKAIRALFVKYGVLAAGVPSAAYYLGKPVYQRFGE